MNIGYVISDHGFGHAARSCCIIRELVECGHNLCIITSVPHSFLIESLQLKKEFLKNIHFINYKTDVGLLQLDSVTIDYEGTLNHLKTYFNNIHIQSKHIAQEILNLNFETITTTTNSKDNNYWIPNIIFSDVSVMGITIKDELINLMKEKVSSNIKNYFSSSNSDILVYFSSNFTWVEIYEANEKKYPEFNVFIKYLKSFYERADGFLCLPFYTNILQCGISPDKVHYIGGMSRTANMERKKVRDILFKLSKNDINDDDDDDYNNTNDNINYLLYSFGGFKSPIDQVVTKWKSPPSNWRVIWIDRQDNIKNTDDLNAIPQKGIQIITQKQLELYNIEYIDLLIAIDVILIKTGFGIVSECIRYDIPVLYVDRPGFVEHLSLVESLKENVPTMEISLQNAVSCSVFDECSLLLKEKHSKDRKTYNDFKFNGPKQIIEILHAIN